MNYKEAGITNGGSTGASWTTWFGRAANYAGERPPTFISKKFTIPKKFRNVATAGEAETFLT